jgi:hypothetical protein
MEVNNIYYQKYLKYKYKYIELKKLIGGAIMCVGEGRRGCLFDCTKFIKPLEDKNNSNKDYLYFCNFCKHNIVWHEKIKKV